MSQMRQQTWLAVLTASDETEPHQIVANSLNSLVESLGRSNQRITEFLQTPGKLIQDSALLLELTKGYNDDSTWHHIYKNPSQFKGFSVINDLLCHSIESRTQLLVIPNVNHKGEGVRGLLIENTHKIIGHYNHTKTLQYMRKYYWWPTMAKDVEKFCLMWNMPDNEVKDV